MLILEDKINFGLEENSISPNYFAQSEILKAIGLWEEATDMLLQAGRIFSQIKESTKREFTKLLSEAGLEKSQVTKLIKASAVAEEIPAVVARRLGTNMLNQLGQPKNSSALEAIEPSDTQVLVVQKIKEHRPPSTLTSREGVRLIGKKKGREKLRIEIPGCAEAQDIYEDFKSSGLSPLQWLQKLRCNKRKEVSILNSIFADSEPWSRLEQKWQHDGRDCSYGTVDGQKVIQWDKYQRIITQEDIARYLNPRVFLDFELITPGALVKIESSNQDKTWNGLPAYLQGIKNGRAKVCLQGDYREKSFSVNDLRVLEPSPIHWKAISEHSQQEGP